MVLGRSEIDQVIADTSEAQLAPIPLWTNVRMFRFDPGWMVMDTVGLAQMELPDLEACFPIAGADEPGAVAGFLRDVSWYLLSSGRDIEDGNTLDGPNGMWRAQRSEEPVAGAPPRPTLRLLPLDGSRPPDALRPAPSAPESGHGRPRRRFGRGKH